MSAAGTTTTKRAGRLKPPAFARRPPANGEDSNLAASIRKFGVLQPIVVDSDDQVIIGMRRQRAAPPDMQVPVIQMDVDQVDALVLRLTDEFSAQDMPWPVKAQAIADLRRLLEKRGEPVTQESLARRLGCDKTTISDYDHVITLPAAAKRLGQEGELSLHAARELARSKELTGEEKVGLARKLASGTLRTKDVHLVVATAETAKPRLRQALTRNPNATLANVRDVAKRQEQAERQTKEEQAYQRVLGIWVRLREWAKKGADSFEGAFVELAPTVPDEKWPRLKTELVRLRKEIDRFVAARDARQRNAGSTPMRVVAEAEGQPIFAELLD